MLLKNTFALSASAVTVFVLFIGSANSAFGQSIFDFSGVVYADYSYTLKSPDSDAEGDNGFGYRRAYFTANYKQSDKISGRFRLEANDKSTTEQGRPAPFVKDMYLQWKGALGDGHDITAGVSSPPSWTVVEKFWGYRSLQKTLQDKGKVLSSRDMGVGVNGNVTSDGTVKYGVMVANNEGVSREEDKHKRVYGQLQVFPADGLSFTVGSDFASYEDGSAVNFNLFGGYDAGSVRVGAEGFVNPRSFDESSDDRIRSGASVFVVADLAEKISGVFRVDRLMDDFMGVSSDETTFLAGVAVKTGPGVEVIPNIIVTDHSEDNDPTVTGRVTLYVDIN